MTSPVTFLRVGEQIIISSPQNLSKQSQSKNINNVKVF